MKRLNEGCPNNAPTLDSSLGTLYRGSGVGVGFAFQVWRFDVMNVRDVLKSVGLTEADCDCVDKALDAAGYVIVPKEPTKEMLNALFVLPDIVGSTITRHTVDKLPDAYRAMIVAAQTQETRQSED